VNNADNNALDEKEAFYGYREHIYNRKQSVDVSDLVGRIITDYRVSFSIDYPAWFPVHKY